MNFFAQLQSAAPGDVVNWLIIALGLLIFGRELWGFIEKVRGKPSVQELEQTTKQLGERCVGMETDIATLSEEFKQDRQASAKEGDDRRRAIYAKIEELRKEVKQDSNELQHQLVTVSNNVSALDKTTDLLNQRLQQMDGKLDRVIEKKR